MQPHPTDPPAPFRAIPTLARLAAAGLIGVAEARDWLAAAAPARATETRLAHALADAVAAQHRARARAAREIARRLAPLLARRAPGAALRAAAREVNAAHGNPLRQAEATALAAHLAAHLAARLQARA
jgi:hypothetical protein